MTEGEKDLRRKEKVLDAVNFYFLNRSCIFPFHWSFQILATQLGYSKLGEAHPRTDRLSAWLSSAHGFGAAWQQCWAHTCEYRVGPRKVSSRINTIFKFYFTKSDSNAYISHTNDKFGFWNFYIKLLRAPVGTETNVVLAAHMHCSTKWLNNICPLRNCVLFILDS